MSVVIPAYNEAGSIGPLLEEICARSHGRHRLLEVLVYDDASTDATASIVDDLALRHPMLRLIRGSRRLGHSVGVGRLLREARGEAIVEINADTAICGGAIEPLVDALEQGGSLAIGANEPVQVRSTIASRASTFSYHIVARLKAGKHREHYAVGNFVAYLRSMVTDIELPVDLISDDHFIAAHIVSRGGHVVDVPRARCLIKPAQTPLDYWRTSRRVLEGERQLWRRYRIGSAPWLAQLEAVVATFLRWPLDGLCWVVMYSWSSLRRSPAHDATWPIAESTKGALG